MMVLCKNAREEVQCMPYKPKKPCGFPGCPRLTEGRYCEEHQRVINRRYEQYERDPECHKRYGRAWRSIRSSYISEHPLCEECLKVKRITKAEEVHHIKPLSEGGTNDKANLIALCKSCHSKTHAEHGRFSRRCRGY